MLTLSFKWPDSLKGKGKIEAIVKNKPSILLEGGIALQELLAEWMRQLNSARSKHGSNHYTPDGIQAPRVEGDKVAVPITIPGINRALHDIVINPVEAKQLAIPVHADAYGISPREYNTIHPKGTAEALFKPKGKDYLFKNDSSGNIVLMYVLKNTVHQQQDRTLLPPAEDMNKTIMEAISDAVSVILNN